MTYHLERSGSGPEYTLEIWSDGPPMKPVCIIPTHAVGKEEAERLAKKMLAAVNEEKGDKHGSLDLGENRVRCDGK